MKRRGKAVFSWLIITLFLTGFLIGAGCTEERPSGSDSAPPPAILVDYSRTGGIAGFEEHLVVFENGQAVYSAHSGSGVIMLDVATLEEVRTLLDSADFPNMSNEYPAESQGSDYITYVIMYQGKTVQTETTGVPEELAPLISLLDSILAFGNMGK
ncbi:MAG TPA: hypothetical protein VMW63_02230 [Methanoregulaceae archaeon]|nr:hypothetical protein [Methanoregulaceae archaeon]